MCEFLQESTIAVKTVVQLILKNTEQQAWERQIEKRKFSHAVEKTIQMSEKLLIPMVYIQDGRIDPSDELIFKNDEEPELPQAENWLRGKVEMEEKCKLIILHTLKQSSYASDIKHKFENSIKKKKKNDWRRLNLYFNFMVE